MWDLTFSILVYLYLDLTDLVLKHDPASAAEWWKSDTEAVINEALKSGLAPNVSDAHTINGHSGPISSCSSQGTISIRT